jgi:putative two-component system response regulator
MAAQIALSHHEWCDGTGYPHQFAGETIPRAGRIAAVADVFGALTHERPYKKAMTLNEAIAEIDVLASRQFDPAVIEVFQHRTNAASTRPHDPRPLNVVLQVEPFVPSLKE